MQQGPSFAPLRRQCRGVEQCEPCYSCTVAVAVMCLLSHAVHTELQATYLSCASWPSSSSRYGFIGRSLSNIKRHTMVVTRHLLVAHPLQPRQTAEETPPARGFQYYYMACQASSSQSDCTGMHVAQQAGCRLQAWSSHQQFSTGPTGTLWDVCMRRIRTPQQHRG